MRGKKKVAEGEGKGFNQLKVPKYTGKDWAGGKTRPAEWAV